MRGKTAVAIGPGVPPTAETAAFIRFLLRACDLPIVIDADGLNAIAAMERWRKPRQGQLILTPHPGEMGRLLNKETSEIQRDRLTAVRDCAKRYGATVVLKGSRTVISDGRGTPQINPTGNAGMGSGGTGDVLCGMIGAFLAQKVHGFDSAILGVYLHGLAGDCAASKVGERSLVARDLITALPGAFRMLEARQRG